MSEPPPPSAIESFPCGTIVYRLILRTNWIDPDTGEAQDAAFQLRPDETGLSVRIAAKCTLQQAIDSMSRVRGVVTLHVGRIRDLGLEVAPDEEDETHGEIIGMPREADDPDQASYLAGRLANQARKVWPP